MSFYFTIRAPSSARRQKKPQSSEDYYRERQRNRLARQRADGWFLLDDVVHHEILIEQYWRLAHEGGQAPGPDGISYWDLTRVEVGDAMRYLCERILDGQYRPGPARAVRIPKRGGRGFRTLRVRNITDRVVQAAIDNALTPFWEREFLDRSMGFRYGRGTWMMLFALEREIIQQDRWVIAIDDIANAFDNLSVDDVMDDHRNRLGSPVVLDLVDRVLRGDEGPCHCTGVDQGGAYSPTALNVGLHFALDVPLEGDASVPSWWRYADNLVFACRDVAEGQRAIARAHELLDAANLELKGADGPPVDLREQGTTVHILGFALRKQGKRIRYELHEAAWEGLREGLDRAHLDSNPPVQAVEIADGWISAYGPALGSRGDDGVAGKICEIMAQHGFREGFSQAGLRDRTRAASRQWKRYRHKVEH